MQINYISTSSTWLVFRGIAALCRRAPYFTILLATWLLSLMQTATADDKPRQVTNPLGMTFVELAAGDFVMGEPDYAKVQNLHRTSVQIGQGLEIDRPAIPVRLSKSFWLGTHEVTVGQFREFAEKTGYKTDCERDGRGAYVLQPDVKNEVDRFVPKAENTWRDPGFVQHDNHPVVCVSWHDAQAFCQWLGKQDGVTYRLPSEAEWEYACRAGTDTIYSSGDNPDTVYSQGNVGDAALERALPGLVSRQRVDKLGADDGDGFAYTAPVGRYKPNAWGLYDMHGNVWEWCNDRFQDRYYAALNTDVQARRRAKQAEQIVDPQGPDTTPQHQYGDWRSMRGGSWYVSPISCRSASRSFAESHDATCYTGFRVVRESK